MLICDTGPLAATLSRRDPYHAGCSALLRDFAGEIAAPAPVVTETALFALERFGPDAQVRFLQAVAAAELDVVDLQPEDHRRVAQLCDRYADLPLDQVDASVVALAERFDQSRIASLDVRHLAVIRTASGRFLELLP